MLQETNLVLWKKADEFVPGSNFLAWAHEVAYFKALSLARDRKRCRLVLDQELVEQLTVVAENDDLDERRVALRHCLSQLVEPHLELLKLRYQHETPLAKVADSLNKTESGVKMSLRRIRLSLMACITKRMEANNGTA